MYRAKMRALEFIHGASDEQYAHLRNYAKEFIRSNPGSSVKIKCKHGLRGLVFERMYVCSNTDMQHSEASNAQANTNDVNTNGNVANAQATTHAGTSTNLASNAKSYCHTICTSYHIQCAFRCDKQNKKEID